MALTLTRLQEEVWCGFQQAQAVPALPAWDTNRGSLTLQTQSSLDSSAAPSGQPGFPGTAGAAAPGACGWVMSTCAGSSAPLEITPVAEKNHPHSMEEKHPPKPGSTSFPWLGLQTPAPALT